MYNFALNIGRKYGLVLDDGSKADKYLQDAIQYAYGDVTRALAGIRSYHAAHVRALAAGVDERIRDKVASKAVLMEDVIARLETLEIIL